MVSASFGCFMGPKELTILTTILQVLYYVATGAIEALGKSNFQVTMNTYLEGPDKKRGSPSLWYTEGLWSILPP